MKRNFSLIFFLKKGKTDQKDTSSIYIRITVEKKRAEVATGKQCLDIDWDNGKVRKSSSAAKSINPFLKQLELKVHDAQRKLMMADEDATALNLMDELLGRSYKVRKLTEVFEDHNDRMKALVGSEFSKMTLLRYQTALRHIRQFLKEKYNTTDIDIKKINHTFLTDYDFFLRTVRKCANNSAVKYIKNLKKIIKICLAHGWIIKDPFANFKATVKVIDRICLNEQEVKVLEQKYISNERLARVKDIFLFSCYTGLAYIDIYQLKKSEVIVGNNGDRWIISNRQKTGTPTRIPLLPNAVLILDKYADHPICCDSDKMFPVSSNQKMNSYLKEIADLCAFNIPLTYHLARHTFATTITLLNDVPIETVSKMLGHKDLKTTQHYAKVMDRKVDNDMAILKQKITEFKPIQNSTKYNYTITK
ncbi:site-specific integrase [Pedobacter miscanthi]|uniref:site-specific integrase n=1 Tax=Pedobacter miscanthi TaxID=2259170 RepID=UPI00292CBB0E|nr:site-specific integrase [Pedobacter miscanthi]